MSIRVMTAVFDSSEARLADRLVLLVIADKSDDDGTGCFRGKESIAHMARVSRATVTRSIQALSDLGELEVIERPGRSNLYRITLPLPGSNRADPRTDLSRHPAQDEPTPGSLVSRDTSSNTSSHSRKTASREPMTICEVHKYVFRKQCPKCLKVVS